MLVSIIMNLMGSGVIPPVTRHNVPDAFIEEKGGGKDDDVPTDYEIKTRVQRDDEDILLLIAQWVLNNNSN